MSATIVEELKRRLEAQLDGARIEVDGADGRYQVVAVGECFAGQSRVKRQQLVYGAIDELIKDGRVHAVTIKALAPGEA